MAKSIEELNEIELDVLKEIGNIGSGNAVTALSKLLNRKVDMSVPNVQILKFDSVANMIGGAGNLIVGVLFGVEGDINGYILFALEDKHAHILVNMLMGRDVTDKSSFTDIDISAIKEIGNIMVGAYLSSLCALTNLKVRLTVPELTIDMAGAILSAPIIEYSKQGDAVLFIETEFAEGECTMVGHFALVPDMHSYTILLQAIGVFD